jgi:hypothetical protein
MGLSLMNTLGSSSSVRIAHVACYWKFFLLHYTQVLCQYRLCRADHAYLTYLTDNGSLIVWTVVSLTTAKFKPLVFPMSGFALFYTANMFILVILYDFCLSKSKSHCDWRSVSQSWFRASSRAHDQIFITVWQLRSCFCGAPPLTRGLVCHLS